MIPHPDDCNWIDPAVRPYSRTESEMLPEQRMGGDG